VAQISANAAADKRYSLDRIPMSRWLIKLQGEKLDVEEFPRWFPGGDIYGIEEKGEYYLTGPAFDRAGNAEEVLKVATQALNDRSAVISLLWNAFRKPSIGQVIHEDDAGKQRAYIFLSGIASGRSKLSGVLVDASGTTLNRTTTQAQDFLATARASSHLGEALTVWADPIRTWGRLYRVVEEIEQHFGKPPDDVGLCSNEDLVRFRRTANTAESSGIDARHACGLFRPPHNPMSLAEGTSFVGQLLAKALRKP
jgi:hypothetical protein